MRVRADEPVRRIDFTLDGQSASVDSPVDANETILAAALRVRPDVPFACAGGVCGTCRARVVEGAVSMTENYALEPDEIERGYVLTCQSHPTSDPCASTTTAEGSRDRLPPRRGRRRDRPERSDPPQRPRLDDLRELGSPTNGRSPTEPELCCCAEKDRRFCAGRDIAGVDPATDDVGGYLDDTLTPLLRRMAAFPSPDVRGRPRRVPGRRARPAHRDRRRLRRRHREDRLAVRRLGATLDSGGHALFAERLGIHATLDLIYTAACVGRGGGARGPVLPSSRGR